MAFRHPNAERNIGPETVRRANIKAPLLSDTTYIRWFRDIRVGDVSLVGGKNASLGELYATLMPAGLRVPNGFAVTADAYRDALAVSHVSEQLHRLVEGVDKSDLAQLERRAAAARKIVYEATAGDSLREQVAAAYKELERQYGSAVAVAVRSSATAEDLPNASFAATRHYTRRAAAVSPRFSPIKQSSTAPTTASTISKSRFPWA
jgi:phosphoenolpyruvate synthase/pyruvate phosphate dikinase